VLISKQVQYEIISSAVDPQENILMLRIKIRNVEMIIGAIYGPNIDNNCLEFFNFISATLNDWPNLPIVLGGTGTPLTVPYRSMKIRMYFL
jgi:hypothetical protein